MINWLITVPVTNKVDGNLTLYLCGLASFTMANKSKNTWVLVIPSYLWLRNQITPDQGKANNRANEYTIFKSNVIITAYSIWTPSLCPCCTLNWIYTVPVDNKVERKPTIYRSVLAFFIMENESTNTWSLCATILPLLDIYFYF